MKSSSITFLAVMFSIIIFSAFISAFPNGINMAERHIIEYSGDNLYFYGGIRGNGNITLYSENSTIIIDHLSHNTSQFAFIGNASFYIPSAIYVSKMAYSHQAFLNGTGYANIDGNDTYGFFSVYINGSTVFNFSRLNAFFIGGKENLTKFLNKVNVENSTIRKFILLFNLLPLPLNKIFLINGNGSIDKKPVRFNNLIFRGNGNYSHWFLNGNSYLIINNKKFFENEKEIKIGIFYIPYKIVILWAAAISLFIVSLFIKREIEFDKIFSSLPIVASLLMIGITFYLWEKQAFLIFGINFFKVLMHPTLASILAMAFIITSYLEFIALIGFPSRIIVSSIMSFFGLHQIGKVVGKAIGYSTGIYLGIKLLPSILNMVFYPLLRLT